MTHHCGVVSSTGDGFVEIRDDWNSRGLAVKHLARVPAGQIGVHDCCQPEAIGTANEAVRGLPRS